MRYALAIIALCAVLVLSGCAPIFSVASSTQLTGSGKLITQDFSFDRAERLLAASNFKVTVAPGDKIAVTVTADDNVMEHLYVHVSNNELRLELKPGKTFGMTNVTMKAEITMPAPSYVTALSNAVIDLGTLRSGDLTLKIQDNGIITGALESGRLTINGSGNGQASLSGAVGELTAKGGGNNIFTLGDLTVHTADITLRENGMATVNATDNLSYNVSGNAGLIYSGSPKLGKQERSGNAYAKSK